MSSVFLFGAGASFGSGNCFPEPPPLGNGQNGLFKKLQERGGFVASIANPLADLFINNFEEGMAEFYSTRESETPAFLREMSLYFSGFQSLEGNLYKELIKFIATTKLQVVYATTIYDLLIEHSICQLGYRVEYRGLPVSKNSFSVLKIHGSCNFLPSMDAKLTNCSFSYCGEGDPPRVLKILDAPVRAAQPYEVIKFCKEEDSIAPAIAMYIKGKGVMFCNNYILQQQEFWKESVFKAKKIFVIGLRVNAEDEHIWQTLASSKAQLLYVGVNEKENFEDWKKETRRKNAHWIANRFDEAMPIIKRHLR